MKNKKLPMARVSLRVAGFLATFFLPLLADAAPGRSDDVLPPTVTPLAPETNLTTSEVFTRWRFHVEDPAPGTVQGKSGRRSGLDLSTLRVTVNGVDRTTDAVMYKNAECLASFWDKVLGIFHDSDRCQVEDLKVVNGDSTEAVMKGVVDYTPATSTPLPQGEVIVVVTIADKAGNVGHGERKIFVDSMGPVVKAVSPANGATLTDDATALVFSITDAGVGVAPETLQVTVNGQDYTAHGALSGEQLTLTPNPNWAEGPLTVTIGVADKLANTSEASFAYTVAPERLSATPRAIPSSGFAPLTVRFIPEFKTDTAIEKFEWDFDGNGVYDRSETVGLTQSYTYSKDGTYTVRLRVTNNRGEQAVGSVTVEVKNAPPDVSARAQPSSGPVPLNVSFTASASDSNGIAKYEWDFNGDGTYDYSSSSGSASYTYNQLGTYPVAVRVTDNYGASTVWASPAMVVTVGQVGAATVSLSVTPTSGNVPLSVTLNATATDTDSTIASYAWDFDGDGTIDSTGTTRTSSHTYREIGTFYPRVQATSADGGIADAVAQIYVKPSVSLSRSRDTIDTGLGETVNITTVLGGTTEVSLVMENRDGEVVRTLVPWVKRVGGSYTDAWDGTDEQGQVVIEADYYAVLLYKIDGQVYRLDHRTTSGGTQFNPPRSSIPSKFSPFANQPLSVNITLNQAAEVTAFVGRFNVNTRLVTLLERKPLGKGTHTLTWNGEDGDGKLFHPPPGDSFLYGLWGFYLANNAVYVRSGAHVTGVKAEPSILDPQVEESRVRFTLTKAASVEMNVFDAKSGRLVASRTVTGLASGANILNWDGRAGDGTRVAPGRYRIGVTAVDENGFRSITVYAMQRVYY